MILDVKDLLDQNLVFTGTRVEDVKGVKKDPRKEMDLVRFEGERQIISVNQ